MGLKLVKMAKKTLKIVVIMVLVVLAMSIFIINFTEEKGNLKVIQEDKMEEKIIAGDRVPITIGKGNTDKGRVEPTSEEDRIKELLESMGYQTELPSIPNNYENSITNNEEDNTFEFDIEYWKKRLLEVDI
ncbi:MAG: hypothetical protein ABIH25_01365 [Candidatus Woesearchaeota archaeon]